MARFLGYEELVRYDPLSRSQIQWLAGQFARLPAFKRGAAVVCGSVSWGSHTWRSDIDVAHFRSREHREIDAGIETVVSNFLDRTGHRLIAPRIDIAVVGAESASLEERAKRKQKKRNTDQNFSIVGPPTSLELGDQTETEIFADALERFGDHIGAIAQLKGQPWRGFVERYLLSGNRPLGAQRAAINTYVAAVSEAWAEQPLHVLNRSPDGTFSLGQLDLLAQAENYPVNLMRRLLAALGRYPKPDRIADIRNEFAKLPDAWARKIAEALPPFAALSDQYESLVREVRQAESRPTSEQFHERLERAAAELPFAAIQEVVWEYLGS